MGERFRDWSTDAIVKLREQEDEIERLRQEAAVAAATIEENYTLIEELEREIVPEGSDQP
jgi:hypothetical protein